MTASIAQPSTEGRRGPSAAAALAVGLVVAVVVTVLTVVGVTFVALAIAFPIAVPIAAAYHLPVSTADAALAEQFAALWWAFAALAVASFGAAAVVAVKAIGFLSPTPRD
ncbi:MAG TPA: hypothetical protein VFY18_08070 [Candidatus Limnocylindrales bacterium]|nr:hypothetical protein [Candidatus Limnocylindrales bacterium]